MRAPSPPSLSGCSGRSAPRSSSSRRPAPFGAAPPPSCPPLARQPAGLRAKRDSCYTSSCREHSSGDELGGSAAPPRRRCSLPARPPRRRGSAAPARSRRASSPTRPRCPSPFASPCACSAAANPRSCPRTRPRSCPRSCEPSRHKSWRRRRRRPRKPTRARLWRVHAALTTSKQLSRCVRHQCALLELFKLRLQHPPELTCNY